MEDKSYSESIRLSTLSPHTREYVKKFDSDNDGSISVDQALASLLKVQEESNSYKKKLYTLIPMFFVLLACMFGVTVGAIHLTKDLYVKNDVLTTSSGTPVKVAQETFGFNIYLTLFSKIGIASQLQSLNIGDISFPIVGIHQSEANRTVHAFSHDGYISLDTNLTMIAKPFKHLENDPMIKAKYDAMQSILSFSSINNYALSSKAARYSYEVDPTYVEQTYVPWSSTTVDYIVDETIAKRKSSTNSVSLCSYSNTCTSMSTTSTVPPPPPPRDW